MKDCPCMMFIVCDVSHHHQCQCQQCQGVNVSGDHKEKKFQNFLKLNDVNDRTSTLKMTDGYSNVGDNAEILVKNSQIESLHEVDAFNIIFTSFQLKS